MLGEIHSLTNDFPEFSDLIHHLTTNDADFSATSKQYHNLDKKIRTLELNNIPTTDEQFTKLKKQRIALKDELYQQLTENVSS